jgi:hypothetical protein
LGCLQENTLFELTQGLLARDAERELMRHADQCDDCRQLLAVVAERLSDAPAQLLGGKYRLGRQLGSGGMGTVYEAVNTWTGRRVAIKLMQPDIVEDREAVERFQREARSATRVAHPNIVEVLDLGHDADGTLFMVQEYLTGETLRQRLDTRGKLPVDEALAIVRAVVDALVSAHEAGVLHRDIKPENIFLTEAGVKLIDFGVCKAIGEADLLSLTGRGRMLGTPHYMSPEQLRADESDGRSDVWAVGVVLFEVLAGERPFKGKTAGELSAKILSEPIPRLPSRGALAAIVERAMARDRERRYPTMRALRAALDSAPRAWRRGRWLRVAPIAAAAMALIAVTALRVRGARPAILVAGPAPSGASGGARSIAVSPSLPSEPARPPQGGSRAAIPIAPATPAARPRAKARPTERARAATPTAAPSSASDRRDVSFGANQAPIIE